MEAYSCIQSSAIKVNGSVVRPFGTLRLGRLSRPDFSQLINAGTLSRWLHNTQLHNNRRSSIRDSISFGMMLPRCIVPQKRLTVLAFEMTERSCARQQIDSPAYQGVINSPSLHCYFAML